MHQLPVRAKSADPANLGTADCALICHCDDGSDYAVKNASSGKDVPHSEWFCKHLGDKVGIASPECRLVEVNGESAFGSRWESGHEPNNWWVRVQAGEIEKDRVAPTISRIFAFDLFVNNVDRHAANYIVRPQMNGAWSFLAFDHSRAWKAVGWPLDPVPMSPVHKTIKNFKNLNNMLGGLLDVNEANFVLDKIVEVPEAYINQILEQQPDNWLKKSECSSILDFWRSDQVSARVDQIRDGLKNGDYV